MGVCVLAAQPLWHPPHIPGLCGSLAFRLSFLSLLALPSVSFVSLSSVAFGFPLSPRLLSVSHLLVDWLLAIGGARDLMG